MQRRLDRMLVYNDDRHDFDEAFMFPLQPPRRNMRASKLRWNLPDGFEPINAAAYYQLWRGDDPAWEAKLQEVLQRREATAQEVAASGWQPPVVDDADLDPATHKMIQGRRIQ